MLAIAMVFSFQSPKGEHPCPKIPADKRTTTGWYFLGSTLRVRRLD
jgi:hypothetical protein